MKKKAHLFIVIVVGIVGLSQAEWKRGLNSEYKSIYIPQTQQSGWGLEPQAAGLDSDGDGVIDDKDECQGTMPNVKVDKKGCPLEAAAVPESNWTLSGIQFETGSDKINASSHTSLDQAADILKTHTRVVVEIQGHTDNVGLPEDNQTLSEKRSLAVQKYLIEKGVPSERLQARGYGATVPVASNDSEEGRSKNRRIQFKVLSR